MATKVPSHTNESKRTKCRRRFSIFPYNEIRNQMLCLFCKVALIEMLVTEICCRVCQSCLDHLGRCESYCPRSIDIIKAISKRVEPDKVVGTEIFDLEISCLNEKCKQWCQLKELTRHLKICEFRENKCKKCGNLYLRKDQEEHDGILCNMSITKCDQCESEMTKKLLSENMMRKRQRKERLDQEHQQEDMETQKATVTEELNQLVEEVHTPINMENMNSLTPFPVKINDFGEFILNYGKVSRIIKYALLHGLTDSIVFPFNEYSVLPGIVLSFILTLDYVAEEVNISISMRHIHCIVDQNKCIIEVKWYKAKDGITLCCNCASSLSNRILIGKMIMQDFTKAYNDDEELILDIAVYQKPEKELRNT